MAEPRVELGAGGPACSRLVAGTMRLAAGAVRGDRLRSSIDGALEVGITTFDLADIYGDRSGEGHFGEVLRASPQLRDRIQIVTKCGIRMPRSEPAVRVKHYDSGRKHIETSVERSLQLLATDRIDLLLLHRPDLLMHPDSIAEAFARLSDSGKVLRFGVSNFRPSQIDLLADRVPMPLAAHQLQLSVLHLDPFENGLLDQCLLRGMFPMAWAPLGGGTLRDPGDPRASRTLEVLSELVADLGAQTVEQVALAWLLRHPARIMPVVGTTDTGRLRQLAGAHALELTREQWYAVWQASTGHEVS